MSHFHVEYILSFIFFNFHACHKSEFWHFRHTWPTWSTGAHQALMEKLEAETTRLFSTVLPSRAHVPACPPSASWLET